MFAHRLIYAATCPYPRLLEDRPLLLDETRAVASDHPLIEGVEMIRGREPVARR